MSRVPVRGLHLKDLAIATALASDAGVELPALRPLMLHASPNWSNATATSRSQRPAHPHRSVSETRRSTD